MKNRTKTEHTRKPNLRSSDYYSMFEAGLGVTEVSQKTSKSKSTISGHYKKWKQEKRDIKAQKRLGAMQSEVLSAIKIPKVIFNKDKKSPSELEERSQEELDAELDKLLSILNREIVIYLTKRVISGKIEDKFLVGYMSRQ